MDDDTSFDSIEGSDDDQLDPEVANYGEGSVYSGGDPDEAEGTEDPDEEE